MFLFLPLSLSDTFKDRKQVPTLVSSSRKAEKVPLLKTGGLSFTSSTMKYTPTLDTWECPCCTITVSMYKLCTSKSRLRDNKNSPERGLRRNKLSPSSSSTEYVIGVGVSITVSTFPTHVPGNTWTEKSNINMRKRNMLKRVLLLFLTWRCVFFHYK